MGVVVRRYIYIDILTIIINFPYSTCIRSFWGSSIPTFCSFLMFFRSYFRNFFIIDSKRYSEHSRSFKNRDPANIII